MKKSILEQFASDAISAPAAITGGSGKKAKSRSKKSGSSKSRSKKSGSSKSGNCGCPPPPPICKIQ